MPLIRHMFHGCLETPPEDAEEDDLYYDMTRHREDPTKAMMILKHGEWIIFGPAEPVDTPLPCPLCRILGRKSNLQLIRIGIFKEVHLKCPDCKSEIIIAEGIYEELLKERK